MAERSDGHGARKTASQRGRNAPRTEARGRRSAGDRKGRIDRGRQPDRKNRSDKEAAPRPKRPAVPEDVTGMELDPAVRRELGSLTKEVAERVARHLVAAG